MGTEAYRPPEITVCSSPPSLETPHSYACCNSANPLKGYGLVLEGRNPR
jgi:hypothetical protein